MTELPPGSYAWPLHDTAGKVIAYWVYQSSPSGRVSRYPRTMTEGGEILDDRNNADEALRSVELLNATVDADVPHEENIARMAEDPSKYAVQYGHLTGRCGVCGRRLTNPESLARGIGPKCLEIIRAWKLANGST